MQLTPKHLELLADNQLTAATLFNVFGGTTLEKGIAYFEAGNVTSYQASKNGNGNVSLTAKVQGNAAKPYTTSVQYNAHNPKWITGVCTCPVTMNCKHTVAALFAYLENASKHKLHEAQRRTQAAPLLAATMPTAPTLKRSPVDQWLNALANTDKAATTPLFVGDRQASSAHLLYFLNKDNNNLNVKLYKANLLKKGGYGKLNSIAVEVILDPYHSRPEEYTFADLSIALLLSIAKRFTAYGGKNLLQGKYGEQALREILQTGRAYWATLENWHTSIPPLSLGETRQIQFAWHPNQQDEHCIQLQASSPLAHYVWLNDKLWYIDASLRYCGLLEHPDLSYAYVDKFLQAPPIPAEQAERVSERLLELLPEADIPAPVVHAQSPIEDLHATLIPDLYLRMTTLNSTNVPLASLRFNYGGHLVQPEQAKPSSLLKVGKQRYRIHRDPAGEQQALDTLADYGFTSANTHYPDWHHFELLMPPDTPALTALRWHDFLEHGVPALQAQGWHIHVDSQFDLQFDVIVELDAAWAESENGNDWFEISLGFEVDGQRINLLPILVDMLAQMDSPQALRALLQRQPYTFVPLAGNRWAKLESQRLSSILDTLVELYDYRPLNADGNLELSRYQGTTLGALLNAPGMQWHGTEELRILSEKLRNFRGIQNVTLPTGLQAELRPYQQEGINWLQFLREYQFNGILADDMGLGKTLQTLTHLLLEKQAGRITAPCMVIAPTSLMGNWRREAKRFTPDLRVQIIHGNDRHQHFAQLSDYDLILTTYPLIVRDAEQYLQHTFHYLILDEAQAIKNAAARTTQTIYTLKAKHRLCLTGTPLENHLGELWSMFHFLMPGFLGTHDKFTRLFRTPIEKQGDSERQLQLRKRVQPFMLRRTKELVAHELPAKTEIIRSVSLEGKQRDLYETVRLAMDKKVQEEISRKGLARSHIMILEALLKLRQVCCDPRLVKLDKAQKVKESAKLELLMTLLPEMLEEGRKILLFSQFTSMLALIEAELNAAHIRYTTLTGETKDRDAAIAQFQEGDAQVFLISLKAGGTGLNLTAADTVIHYDPWWNPAVEQQATDRAYRIGQDKPVFVYKLITEDTVEEKIRKLQEKKQALADALYNEGTAQAGARFSSDDLLDLLKPLESVPS